MNRCWSLSRDEPGYPACLESCPDPPGTLYGIGDASLLTPGLAVVGSRKATPYGLACARRFAGWSAARGVAVVSGAAAGCDLAAHESALEAGGPTVAVLGCGPDVDYPRVSGRALARMREVACVVSEQPPGSQPRRWMFPRRNRIIAALGSAVLVVEAALPSGTFSTADAAADAGREVLAVPGSVFAQTSMGTNRLLRQGAHVVACEEDLHDVLSAVGLLQGAAPGTGPARTTCPVAAAALAGPVTVDEITHATGLAARHVLGRLAALELDGGIARYPDGRYGPAGP